KNSRRVWGKMIKGVNRQIIEVTDTQNEYFERALLIVRPKFSDTSYGRLYDEARRYVKNAGGYTSLKLNKKQRRKEMIIHGTTCGMFGVIIGALMMLFFR
ncbi:MAG TPA: hypothetical protein PLG48_07050, partial [Candidatus Avimonas sp.]|nr:hypothetical protein [Candidatus Avimonas sp.]